MLPANSPLAIGLAVLSLAVVAWLLVRVVQAVAVSRQILDVPGERSSHSHPVPRGGGIAIVLVTLAVSTWVAVTGAPNSSVLPAYIGGSALIAAISWLDDVRSVPWPARMACHLLAALLVVGTWLLSEGPARAGLEWSLLGAAMVVWIVALTNIYNFMDGIDGLAAGQAIVAGLYWTILGTLSQTSGVAAIGLAVTAGALGFILHNWAPARIFMGDVGSAFLGYTFAVLPLLQFQGSEHWVVLLGGVLAVWPFVFDGTLTLIRRAWNRENVFRAHRSHLYQRLVRRGETHARVSTLYIGFALVSAACACWLVVGGAIWALAGLPLALGVALFLAVDRIERRRA